MGKLGPTLIKSCESNFIDVSLIIFSHEILLEYKNKFEEKTLSDPILHLTDAFEFGTFFLWHTVGWSGSPFQSLLLAPPGLLFLLIRAIGAYTDLSTTYLMESTGAHIPYHYIN